MMLEDAQVSCQDTSCSPINLEIAKCCSRSHSGYIVFITGANESKRFHFETARNLGLRVIVIDSNKSSGLTLQKDGSVDRFIAFDLNSDADIAARQCVSALRETNLPIIGIVTFMEMAVLVCSKVAQMMDLPGHSPMSVAIARDKKLTRVVTSEAGLPSMRHYTIKMTEDLLPAAEYVMFPAVLKPIIGADSLGVKRVNSLADLQEAFYEAKRVVQSVIISSGLLCTSKEESSSHSTIVPMEFILEEYLDGDEVDIDIVLRNNKCIYAAVSDNGETFEPYFTETFGVLPSRLSGEIQQGLIQLAIDSATAIGLESGVFHIEAKQTTTRGPRLIEINARLGGGPICEMHKRVYGIDLAAEQIRISCGLSSGIINQGVVFTPLCCFAYMTTNAISSGRIGRDFDFIDTYTAIPGVELIKCRVNPGDSVVGPEDGQPSWLVEIWMTSSTAASGGGTPSTLVDEICDVSDMVARDFEDRYD